MSISTRILWVLTVQLNYVLPAAPTWWLARWVKIPTLQGLLLQGRQGINSKGLRMGDGPLEEIFENSVDPYLDITGDKDKIKTFLDDLGIKGELRDLSEEQLTKLSSVIILKLVKQGSFPAIKSLIGDNYHLDREVVPNIYDFVNILNACGKDEKAGIALSLCMRDASFIDEAKAIARENQRALISVMKKAQA